jgi:ribose-phosphate pyrophosphokinase
MNLHGGLSLITTPGIEPLAITLREKIEAFGRRPGNLCTKVDVVIPDIGINKYAQGEPKDLSSHKGICGHDCFVLASGPGTDEMVMTMLRTLYATWCHEAQRVTVIFGYLPWSRTDKTEEHDNEMWEFTLPQLLLELMRAATGPALLKRVYGFDLHAPIQTAGEFLVEVSSVRILLEQIFHDLGANIPFYLLDFTDDGSAKRASRATVRAIENARNAGLCSVTKNIWGAKRRYLDGHTESNIFGDLDDICGNTPILIEDEVASFGTMNGHAKILIDTYGAKEVWAVAVHPVLCGKAVELLSKLNCPISRLYIADSTIPIHNRPELAPLIASGRLVPVSILEAWAIIPPENWTAC